MNRKSNIMNYLIVVNKLNLIDDTYFEKVCLIECKDILGDSILAEEKTYDAYVKLKKYLESKGIYIGLDSAYRSIEEQQEIIDDYTNKYGSEYVKKYVASARTSEHHTGLALDIGLIINGKAIIENDDLFANEDIFLKIHEYLSDYGFILRYPKGKEHITGYSYEPWHIRYVGIKNAKEIEKNMCMIEEIVSKVFSK
jgi:D-alanyl-D-alanine carboxypeptidase